MPSTETSAPDVIKQVKAWLFPTVMGIVGFLIKGDIADMKDDIKELKADAKEWNGRSATDKVEIDVLKSQVQKLNDKVFCWQENRGSGSPYKNLPNPTEITPAIIVRPQEERHYIASSNYPTNLIY